MDSFLNKCCNCVCFCYGSMFSFIIKNKLRLMYMNLQCVGVFFIDFIIFWSIIWQEWPCVRHSWSIKSGVPAERRREATREPLEINPNWNQLNGSDILQRFPFCSANCCHDRERFKTRSWVAVRKQKIAVCFVSTRMKVSACKYTTVLRPNIKFKSYISGIFVIALYIFLSRT